jgi:hypothetical protein
MLSIPSDIHRFTQDRDFKWRQTIQLDRVSKDITFKFKIFKIWTLGSLAIRGHCNTCTNSPTRDFSCFIQVNFFKLSRLPTPCWHISYALVCISELLLALNTMVQSKFNNQDSLQDFKQITGPQSLIFNGYRGLLPLRVKRQGMKLPTHLHLVSRLRMRGAIYPLPQYVFMSWCLIKHKLTSTFNSEQVVTSVVY